jgi:serine/threonine-protein kinase
MQKIGKYVVLDEIGSGGMGVVYRAHDPALDREVAIKMLKRSNTGGDGKQLEKYFFRELKATASLQHKNIVTVFESGEQDGNPYLVMEYLQGKPVSQLIEERSTMALTERLNIVVQVCDGLQYAHNRNPQIIHRDVKPANVILLVDGVAKIVDFGIARVVGSETTIIQTGQLLGSLPYMSPEQINSVPIDARTDIYSVGVLLYQLLTFSLPFKGADTGATLAKILHEAPAPLSHFIDDVPPGLQDCLSRALEKDPDARYQSAEELGFDLLQIQKCIRDRITADLMLRAEEAIQYGDLAKGSSHLQEIIRLDRQHERANRLLAEIRKTMRSQQRTAQIKQLHSQARVALKGRQFEQAVDYADQALKLDPRLEESIALCNQIAKATAQAKSADDLLRRAEAALQSSDLEVARQLISSALFADPANLEARTIEALIERQQAEQIRRSQVQALLDRAHRLITEHKYADAKNLLTQAQQLDPTETRVTEFLAWANEAQQQEQLQKDLQKFTERVDDALRSNDLTGACKICDLGLEQFPNEPALLRLKSIAENLQYASQKRRYVQDQLFAARKLADSAKLEQAIELLSLALEKYPAEPSLAAALADLRAEAELRQRLQAEASARSQHKVTVAGTSLGEVLDAPDEIKRIGESAAPVQGAVSTSSEPSPAEAYGPLLKEASLQRSSRDQALNRLDALLSTVQTGSAVPIAPQIKAEARSIRVAFPNEPEINEKSTHLLYLVAQREAELESLLLELKALESGSSKPQVQAATRISKTVSDAVDTTALFNRPKLEDPEWFAQEKTRIPFLTIALTLAVIAIAFFSIRLLVRPAKPEVPTAYPRPSAAATFSSGTPSPSPASVATVPVVSSLPPALSSLSPASIPAGSPGVKVSISGSGFVPDKTQFLWNGSPRRANVVTEKDLTAELTKADLAVVKKASIAIQTPAGKSITLPFEIEGGQAPVIISLAPASIPAGSPGFALKIAMRGIVPGKTRLRWNGASGNTITSNETTLAVDAGQILVPRQIPITISNPPYDANSSVTLSFPVGLAAAKTVLISAGTTLSVELDKPLSSTTSHTGEPINASLTKDVLVDGVTVLKTGTPVKGVVKFAKAKNFLRAGLLVITFNSIHANGSDYAIRSEGIDSAAGQKPSPQKASDYFSLLDNSVYPEKDSLKDSLKAAGVGPADAIFEGDLRKDVQLSSDLTFKLNAPLDLRSTGAQAAQAAQDIITLPNHHGVLPTPVSQ